jgi:hypothetical protein
MTKAEPDWGYRFLEAGERTQEGDECRDFDFEKWRPVDEGWSVHPGEGHLYRRRQPAREHIRAADGYAAMKRATLHVFEILPDGREVQSVTAKSCQHDPNLWLVEYQFSTPGSYEMDSSMQVVRR